jgi:PII-like signaling protein
VVAVVDQEEQVKLFLAQVKAVLAVQVQTILLQDLLLIMLAVVVVVRV